MEALSTEVLRIQEVMAELTTKIQDGTSRLEVLKAEASVQPSPFTVPRSLRVRIALMEGSMEGDMQEAKRSKICATTVPDVVPSCRSGPRLGGFRPSQRRRHLALDARDNIGKDWSRGGKVVPRHGHRSCELFNSPNDTFVGGQDSPLIDVNTQATQAHT